MMDALPKLKALHPTLVQKELMSMAASQWSHLDDDSKKVLSQFVLFLIDFRLLMKPLPEIKRNFSES
jgi:hypothetical protein